MRMVVRNERGLNLCKQCPYAKDSYGDACYCTMYGYIVSFGKEKCRGYEQIRKPEGTDHAGRNV